LFGGGRPLSRLIDPRHAPLPSELLEVFGELLDPDPGRAFRCRRHGIFDQPRVGSGDYECLQPPQRLIQN
jgi:hypothetical protein